MLHEMKGLAKTVMVGHSPTRGRVELARFADGSWAIRQGGPTIGVWEPEEWLECFRVFGMLAGLRVPPHLPADATTTTTALTRQGGEHDTAGGAWN
jgi:hypothetical protein